MTNPEQFREQSSVDPVVEQPYLSHAPKHSAYPSEPMQPAPDFTHTYPSYPAGDVAFAPGAEPITIHRPPISKKAIFSIILGIFGLGIFPLAFIAIILGVLAKKDISQGKTRGKVIAIIGIVVSVIVSLLILMYTLSILNGYNS